MEKLNAQSLNKGIMRPTQLSNIDQSAARKAYEKKLLQGNDPLLEEEQEDEEDKDRKRVQDLLNRKTTSLSLSQLFELSRLAPWQMQDTAIETKIREMISSIVSEVDKRQCEVDRKQSQIEAQIKHLDSRYRSDMAELIKVPKMERQVNRLAENVNRMQNEHSNSSKDYNDIKNALNNNKDNFQAQILDLKAQHEKLEAYVHQPNDIQERLDKTEDTLTKRLTKQLGKMQKKVERTVQDNDEYVKKTEASQGRVNRMYERMKKDVIRHETLCYELAKKFEQHLDYMLEMTDNIESLKTNALINDLHLEAYQPLQTAQIAFEVVKCSLQQNKEQKFKSRFVKKVIKQLERNVVNILNPTVDNAECRYRKLEYKINSSLVKFKDDNAQNPGQKTPTKSALDVNAEIKKKWEQITEKLTFNNIHLFTEQNNGGVEIKETISIGSNIAELLVRRQQGKNNLIKMELTGRLGKLSRAATEIPFQESFMELLNTNKAFIEKPLDVSKVKYFHEEQMSKIGQQLRYAKTEIAHNELHMNEEKALTDEQKIELEKQFRKELFLKAQQENKLKKERKQNKTEDSDSIDYQSEDEANEQVKKNPMKITANQLENRLYSNIEVKKDSSSDSESEEAVRGLGGYAFDQAQQERQRKEIENIKEMCEVRVTEAEDFFKESLAETKMSLEEKVANFQEDLKDLYQGTTGDMRQYIDAKTNALNSAFDVSLDEVHDKIDELAKMTLANTQKMMKDTISEEDSDESDSVTSSESKSNRSGRSSESLSICFESDSMISSAMRQSSRKSTQSAAFGPKALHSVEKEKRSKDKAQKDSEDISKKLFKSSFKKQKTKKAKKTREEEMEEAFVDPNSPMKKVLNLGNQLSFRSDALSFGLKNPIREEDEEGDLDGSNQNVLQRKKGPKRIQSSAIAMNLGLSMSKAPQFVNNMLTNQQLSKELKQDGGAVNRIAQARESTKQLASLISSTNLAQYALFEKHEGSVKSSTHSSSPMRRQSAIINCMQPIKRESGQFGSQQSGSQFRKAPQKRESQFFGNPNAPKRKISQAETPLIQFQESKMTEQVLKKIDDSPEKFKDSKSRKSRGSGGNKSMRSKKSMRKRKPTMRARKGSDNSDSFNFSGSYQSSEDYADYVTKEDFEDFKKICEKFQAEIDQKIFLLQGDHDIFTKEMLLIVEKIDSVDWNVKDQADEQVTKTAMQFQAATEQLKDQMIVDVRKWQRKQTDLSARYESIYQWSKMFSQMNLRLREEIFRSQNDTRKHIENIGEYVSLQIKKDIQDEIDKENFNLLGLQEKDKKPPNSPVSGNSDVFRSTMLNRSCLNPLEEPSQDSGSFGNTNTLFGSQPVMQIQNDSVSMPGLNSHHQNGQNKQQIFKAYKLACLNYTSSLVPLADNKKYSRKQVTAMQEGILQTIAEEIYQQREEHEILSKTLKMEFDMRTTEFEPKIVTSPRFIQQDITKTFEKIVKDQKWKIKNKDINQEMKQMGLQLVQVNNEDSELQKTSLINQEKLQKNRRKQAGQIKTSKQDQQANVPQTGTPMASLSTIQGSVVPTQPSGNLINLNNIEPVITQATPILTPIMSRQSSLIKDQSVILSSRDVSPKTNKKSQFFSKNEVKLVKLKNNEDLYTGGLKINIVSPKQNKSRQMTPISSNDKLANQSLIIPTIEQEEDSLGPRNQSQLTQIQDQSEMTMTPNYSPRATTNRQGFQEYVKDVGPSQMSRNKGPQLLQSKTTQEKIKRPPSNHKQKKVESTVLLSSNQKVGRSTQDQNTDQVRTSQTTGVSDQVRKAFVREYSQFNDKRNKN